MSNGKADGVLDGIVINQSPRPRLLVRGFAKRESLVQSILQLAPTSKAIKNVNEVRQLEWDVLVTDSYLAGVADHIFILYVAKDQPDAEVVDDRDGSPGWNKKLMFGQLSMSQELKRFRDLSDRIAELTKGKLEPTIKGRQRHRCYYWARKQVQHSPALELPELQPFITTADDEILAGRYTRGATSEAWLLPPDTPDVPAWVSAAMAEWHGASPDRFPGLADWATREEWMTPSELAIRVDIDSLDAEHQEASRRFEERKSELKERLAKALERGNTYERALLTAQSDDLKVAVMNALEELGFSVQDADQLNAADDHLEDLHITDPMVPDWIALGEVKGYSKGAKTEALTQFVRFDKRYVQRHGKPPDAEWYVVNQFLARDPGSRPLALNGKDEDVQAFAQGGGLVIDTVTLFRILMDVRRGILRSAEVRTKMRGSTGRLAYPFPS